MGFVLHRYIFHNDGIQEASARVLSAGQIGLLSGWGVFSTIRVIEGVPFAFERHWARLTRDAAAFHITLPGDPESVRRKLLALIEANHANNSTMRLVFVRNGGGMWEGPSVGRSSDLIALTADTKRWGPSAKLAYVAQARHAACEFAGTKIISWAMNLTWIESAQARGFDEVILLNERGEVSECTSANIFVAKGDQVWTPPLASGCLPGITREVLLSEIHIPGIQIGEKTLLPADLETADEVFITSTTRNLLPVNQIEDKPLKRSEVVCNALERAFEGFVERYVAEKRSSVPARM
jgi:branched-chain amino acid aminotransferase